MLPSNIPFAPSRDVASDSIFENYCISSLADVGHSRPKEFCWRGRGENNLDPLPDAITEQHTPCVAQAHHTLNSKVASTLVRRARFLLEPYIACADYISADTSELL